MAKQGVLILVAFVVMVCAAEDDNEQKKRGASKVATLNAIPTGAQKPEYTYSIYPQNPSSQSSQPSSIYQSQVPNSFYPNQGSQQYYASPNPTDSYSSQPQINLIPPQSSSPFVPLNFVPNPGYQTKYQILPSKSQNGNIQFAFVPQQAAFPSPFFPYSHYLSPNPTQLNSQQGYGIPNTQFNIAPNYQQLLSNQYLGQPSTMLYFAQPNPAQYSNLVYQNPVPNYYNYVPNNNQPKYNVNYGSAQSQTVEYEKLPPAQQVLPKEDNDISSQNSEYISSPDANNNYKNTYTASRSSTYSKL